VGKTHIQRWAPQDWRTSRVRARSAMTGDYMLRLVYLESLSALYEAGGYLPADPDLLADELLLPAGEIARCLPILDALARSRGGRGGLLIEDDRISNPRVSADLAEEQAYRDGQAEHGRQSGRVRREGSPKGPSRDREPATTTTPASTPATTPATTGASGSPGSELARFGEPGEAEGLQAELGRLLAEVSAELGIPQDELLSEASRTPGGKEIQNIASCSSVSWLRTTTSRLLARRSRARAEKQPTPAAQRSVDRVKALISGGLKDEQ